MRTRRASLVWIVLAPALAACGSGTASLGSHEAEPSASPPAESAAPTPSAAWSPEPAQRRYGPEYTPLPMASALQPINLGALLTADRSTLIVSFLAGGPYDPAQWCTEMYRPWLGVRGDTLEVAIAVHVPPSRATMPPNGACTLAGYTYTFTLSLPQPFLGSTVRDLGAQELWVPPPERTVRFGALPDDWTLYQVRTTHEAGVEAVSLTYGPIPPGEADPSVVFISQRFGSAPEDEPLDPVATAMVHGQSVTIMNAGGGGLRATWRVGADWVTATAHVAGLDLEGFVELANSVAGPGP